MLLAGRAASARRGLVAHEPPPRGARGPQAPLPQLGRLRVAITAFFAVHGFIFASWAVRVPAVKQQTGASSGTLGLALLGLSAGAVATMLVAGSLSLALRQSSGDCGVVRADFGNRRAASAGPFRDRARPGTVRVRRRIRRPERRDEQRRGGPGRRLAPPRDAWLPRGLELRRLAARNSGGLLAPHLSPLRHFLLLVPVGLACHRRRGPGAAGAPGPGNGRRRGLGSPTRASGPPQHAANRTRRGRLRADRPVLLLRRGCDRRLGRAAPSAGPRRQRGPGRRWLRGFRVRGGGRRYPASSCSSASARRGCSC